MLRLEIYLVLWFVLAVCIYLMGIFFYSWYFFFLVYIGKWDECYFFKGYRDKLSDFG